MTVTLALIILNALISWQAFQRTDILEKLKHYPYAEKRVREWSRLITGTFVHGDWMHLAFNMYALYSFGEALENKFIDNFGSTSGRVFYLLVYLLSGLLANLVTYHKQQDNPGFASVGASGSVSGVLFSFIIFYPLAKLLLFYIIPIPGILAAILYLIYSTYAGKKGQGNIDHTAHFWGAISGFVLTLALKPALWNEFIELIKQGF
ncbi:MAG: rhomboid family intramembrane serine protease [Saprospiraceae bacterium]